MKGLLFPDNERLTGRIKWPEAGKRKFFAPNAEVSCLIRMKFSDEELKAMGLWHIVIMHEPFKDSMGVLRLLGETCRGTMSLSSFPGRPEEKWSAANGFAFEVRRGIQ